MAKQIKLPKYPKDLPDDVEVRDFDLGGGKFGRVIMELRKEQVMPGDEHFVLTAQAYEMDKSGNFKTAPLGYPSRTASSPHSVQASALGLSINLDDSWVMVPLDFDLNAPTDGVAIVNAIPKKPADAYGVTVFHKPSLTAYRWTEGFADTIARTKIEELQRILSTSDVRSGFAFRNRRT